MGVQKGEAPTRPRHVSVCLWMAKAAGAQALFLGHDSYCSAPGAGCSICKVCAKQIPCCLERPVALFAKAANARAAGDLCTKVGCERWGHAGTSLTDRGRRKGTVDGSRGRGTAV